MNRSRTSLLVLVLLLAGCGPDSTDLRCMSATDRSPMLGENFTVRYHESSTIQQEQLTLSFADLVGDSRCPSGVQCVWEGNAEVHVGASKPGQESQSLDLNTNGSYATQATYANYRVALTSVVPYPEADRQAQAPDYCVGLRVTKFE